MKLTVVSHPTLAKQFGVLLGCGWIFVSQDLLKVLGCGSILQQMNGQGMAQTLGRDILLDAGLAGTLLDDLPKTLARQPASIAVDEQGRLPWVLQQRRAAFDIFPQLVHRSLIQREHPLMPAGTAQKPHVQMQIVHIQRSQCRYFEPGGIQQFQHGSIPAG